MPRMLRSMMRRDWQPLYRWEKEGQLSVVVGSSSKLDRRSPIYCATAKTTRLATHEFAHGGPSFEKVKPIMPA
jgi:hypothetical protein